MPIYLKCKLKLASISNQSMIPKKRLVTTVMKWLIVKAAGRERRKYLFLIADHHIPSLIRVILISINSFVVYDELKCTTYYSASAACSCVIFVTINQLLFREADKWSSHNLVDTFDGPSSPKSPTRTYTIQNKNCPSRDQYSIIITRVLRDDKVLSTLSLIVKKLKMRKSNIIPWLTNLP